METVSLIQVAALVVMGALAVRAALHAWAWFDLRSSCRKASSTSYVADMRIDLTPGFVSAVADRDRDGILDERLPVFERLIDQCERGLQYAPAFGLMFTVVGGLLAILTATSGGTFDRLGMVEGIGVSMLSTFAGMAILVVEFSVLRSAEALEADFRYGVADAILQGSAIGASE